MRATGFRSAAFIATVFCAAIAGVGLAGAAAAKETIVFIRHGEKPAQGLGQLDCRGLNRALALPGVIDRQFGRPDAILAPNPSAQKDDGGVHYDYVRPLATVEPTAVAFGLPVEARVGFDDVAGLTATLEAPERRDALVLVAWEHRIIDAVARELLRRHGGDPALVPDWASADFDGVDVVTIDWSGPSPTATFARGAQGLNGLPDACPK
jgi:hypothetical protein